MTTRLVFLLPRIESNFFSAKSLLQRQDLYATYLKEIQGNAFTQALLLYSGDVADLRATKLDCLEVKCLGSNKLGTFGFALRAISHLKQIRIKDLLLVAGTPFQPFLIARLIKLFFPKAKIQVSIHGEIGGVRSNRSKSIFFRTQIRYSDAIRFVSDEQRSVFLKEYGISKIPNVVAPVPIDIPRKTLNAGRATSIGFVGRIHLERDPLLWAEISQRFPNARKIVVGDGPMRNTFISKLEEVSFLGRLEGERLKDSWAEIGVLLSTAPYESYGLALREALLNGVPVVARKSAGVTSLNKRFPNLVRTFDSKDEAVEQITQFIENLPTRDEFEEFRIWFSNEQTASLQSLANLWNSLGY